MLLRLSNRRLFSAFYVQLLTCSHISRTSNRGLKNQRRVCLLPRCKVQDHESRHLKITMTFYLWRVRTIRMMRLHKRFYSLRTNSINRLRSWRNRPGKYRSFFSPICCPPVRRNPRCSLQYWHSAQGNKASYHRMLPLRLLSHLPRIFILFKSAPITKIFRTTG